MRLKYPSGHIYDVPDDADQATIDQVSAYDRQTYGGASGNPFAGAVAGGSLSKPSLDDALARMAKTYKYPGKVEMARRAAARADAAIPAWKKAGAPSDEAYRSSLTNQETTLGSEQSFGEKLGVAPLLEPINRAIGNAAGTVIRGATTALEALGGGPVAPGATMVPTTQEANVAGRFAAGMVNPLEWVQGAAEGDPLSVLALAGLPEVGKGLGAFFKKGWERTPLGKRAIATIAEKSGMSEAQATETIRTAAHEADLPSATFRNPKSKPAVQVAQPPTTPQPAGAGNAWENLKPGENISINEWAKRPESVRRYEGLWQKYDADPEASIHASEWAQQQGLSKAEADRFSEYAFSKANEWIRAQDEASRAVGRSVKLSRSTLDGPLNEADLRNVSAEYRKNVDWSEQRSPTSEGPLSNKERADRLFGEYMSKVFQRDYKFSMAIDTYDDLFKVPEGKAYFEQFVSLARDNGIDVAHGTSIESKAALPGRASSQPPPPTAEGGVLDKMLWEAPFNRLEGRFSRAEHRASVESALKEGKPVPPEVLKDYPDLAAKYGQGVAPVADVAAPGGTKTEPPTTEPPKPPEGPVTEGAGNVTGPARRFVDEERKARGLEPLPPQPKDPQQLAEVGGALLDKDPTLPKSIWQKVMLDHEAPTLDDAAVANVHKDRLTSQMDELVSRRAKGEAVQPQIDALNVELDKAEALSSQMGSHFHGLGMAQQIAHNVDDMSFVALERRARDANYGGPVHPDIQKRLDQIATENQGLRSELDTAKAKIQDLWTQLAGKRTTGSAAKRRDSALTALKRLGFQVAEHGAVEQGGMGAQAGAARLGTVVTTEIRDNIRRLAGAYRDMGITDLDGMLAQFQKDVPGIREDAVLGALDKNFQRLKNAADLKRAETNRIMDRISREANWRVKSTMQKAVDIALAIPNSLQRGVMLGFDLSAGLLQGKVGLLTRPGSWLKAWGPTFRAVFAKPFGAALKDKGPFSKIKLGSSTDEVAAKLFQEVKDSPAYDRLQKAGFQFREASGPYTAQEEFFRDAATKWVPGIARSDSAFSAMLNSLYADIGRKEFAAADWYQAVAKKLGSDPLFNAEGYDKDIAAMLNIMSGRGHGKVAKWLGERPAGTLALAPRYAWSGVQFASGVPLWGAKTGAGRVAAAAMYTRTIATVAGATIAAKELFGWDVDTDVRSGNFGMVTTPDGWRFDLFNQLTQVTRLPINIFYGKVTNKGAYQAPGDFGFNPLDDFISGKMVSSPLVSDIRSFGSGKIYDNNEQVWRDATPADLAQLALPLSWQNLGTAPWYMQTLDVLGGRVKSPAVNPKKKVKPTPEFDLANPPGLNKWLGR